MNLLQDICLVLRKTKTVFVNRLVNMDLQFWAVRAVWALRAVREN